MAFKSLAIARFPVAAGGGFCFEHGRSPDFARRDRRGDSFSLPGLDIRFAPCDAPGRQVNWLWKFSARNGVVHPAFPQTYARAHFRKGKKNFGHAKLPLLISPHGIERGQQGNYARSIRDAPRYFSQLLWKNNAYRLIAKGRAYRIPANCRINQ